VSDRHHASSAGALVVGDRAHGKHEEVLHDIFNFAIIARQRGAVRPGYRSLQRVESSEQGGENGPGLAANRGQRADDNNRQKTTEQRAIRKGQRQQSTEQRAESKEQGGEKREQRVESKDRERRVKSLKTDSPSLYACYGDAISAMPWYGSRGSPTSRNIFRMQIRKC
jgi:hypothetical protein